MDPILVAKIAARYTRNGTTAWQAVGEYFGISRERARAIYEATTAISVVADQLAVTETECETYRSPHVREPIIFRIIAILTRGPQPVSVLSTMTQTPTDSVRRRLNEALAMNLVDKDGNRHCGRANGRTWSITPAGRAWIEAMKANTPSIRHSPRTEAEEAA